MPRRTPPPRRPRSGLIRLPGCSPTARARRRPASCSTPGRDQRRLRRRSVLEPPSLPEPVSTRTIRPRRPADVAAGAARQAERGDRLCDEGQHAEAASAYRAAIAAAPNFAYAHASLAVSLCAMGRYAEADTAQRRPMRKRAASTRTIRPAMTASAACSANGDVTRRSSRPTGRRSAAIRDPPTHTATAVRLAPSDPAGHRALGELLHATGRRNEAAAHLREARRLKAARF